MCAIITIFAPFATLFYNLMRQAPSKEEIFRARPRVLLCDLHNNDYDKRAIFIGFAVQRSNDKDLTFGWYIDLIIRNKNPTSSERKSRVAEDAEIRNALGFKNT
jgi:hypothetical protein